MTPLTRINGMPIHVSLAATERALRWPEKKRSRRLHKKLTNLRGNQIWDKPCSYVIQGTLFIHPTLLPELRRRTTP